MTPERWAKVRQWLYAIVLAAMPIGVHYGYVSVESAPLWVALIVAMLNVSPTTQTPDDYAQYRRRGTQ